MMNTFVICINNKDNPASLILGKVYQSLPDNKAESLNMIRVLDEDKTEADGYLYAASMFAPVKCLKSRRKPLLHKIVNLE